MMLSTFSADYLNPATLFPVFHLLLHRPHTYLALPQLPQKRQTSPQPAP